MASIDGAVVRRYEKGAYFGELALLSNAKRAATVTAMSPLKCYTLTQQAFVQHIPAHLFESEHVLQIRERLKSSEAITSIIGKCWAWAPELGGRNRFPPEKNELYLNGVYRI